MTFALVFPGQGSQSVGMMAAYGDDAVIRATFAEASDALGEDLWQMVEEGPAERLALTVNTQPLMLAAGVAVYRAWIAHGGPVPQFVAGHSLGEYSALVAAGVLRFADAVPLVRFRAQCAVSRTGHAGGRPGRRGGDGGAAGFGDRRGACGVCRGGRGRSGRSCEHQRAGPDRDRRRQSRGGARDRGGQDQGRQARHAIAGVGAFSLRPDEAGLFTAP